MVKAPAAAGLVTPSRLALRQQPGFLGTAFETVHLATIAMAADQYLCAAPPAEKQPGRHAGLIGATASAIRRSRVVFWTHPLLSAILIPHCAPARCRARRSVKLFGFTKLRYRGLEKNAQRLFVACSLANLFMIRRRLMPA